MPPTLTPDSELAQYPPDIQQSIRNVEQAQLERFRYYTEHYGHSERREGGAVVHYDKDGAIMGSGPIDSFFSLSYASWLTIPRMALQEMPPDWQARFVDLLHEAEEKHGLKVPDGIFVMRKVGQRFVSNAHWNNYRRSNTAQAEAEDRRLGYVED